MPDIRFDTFYRYDDLTRLLHAYAEEYPNLVKVQSIGKSYEDRDIWLATVTNFETGPAEEKPTFWADGNIHASELSPSTLLLYTIHTLTDGYGEDDDITRCLDTRAFYIVPRLNPDGAEWALADKPKIIRSSTRPYPYDEDPVEGLLREDIDGDGRILNMRIPDPNGLWKNHPDEPRLLVRRDPTETGGMYYRVLPEGRLIDYDGVTIKVQPPKEGLDMNRNFPMGWRAEHEQKGAGPYPASEPEVRAMVDFVAKHDNIISGIHYHTFSGLLLRPYSIHPDDEFPAEDLWTYQKIGEKGKAITGYPPASVFHEFKYHPKEIITGGADDWLYDHRGIFAWTVELWAPVRQAGIKDYKYIDWFREHPVEDDLKLLKWNDETLGGGAYVNWYEYDHPQLGKVELGGWDMLNSWTNPPAAFLEKEIAPFPQWMVWHLLISPRLEVREASAEPVGEGAYRVRLVVDNTGWLPTYVTKKAQENKITRGVVCEIALPDGAALASGKARGEFGQLEGRAYKQAFIGAFGDESTDNRLKVEWVVQAPQGGAVELVARHARAGTVRASVELS